MAVEVQPKKEDKVEEDAKVPDHSEIELKPHLFKAYLKSLGFRLLTTVMDPANRASKPLYIYQK
jgi:hypothetical protein